MGPAEQVSWGDLRGADRFAMGEGELERLPPSDPTGHRTFSTLGLLVIGFFWCAGGVYGCEAFLEAAPAGYVFLGMLVGAIGYGVPLAMISAEMACAFPYDGGLVAWIEEACGARLGAHNAYWNWLSYLFDSAAYPVFAAEYFGERLHLSETQRNLVSDGFVVLVTLIKLGGTDYIVKASGTLFVMSVIPITIFVLVGAKDLEPSTWIDTDTSEEAGGMSMNLLISYVIWTFSGFTALGSLAGETKNPGRSYPIVIAILLPFVLVYYFFPLLVALSLDSDRENYYPGQFDTLATELCGEWLGIFFIVGATASFLGLYNAQIIVCERSMAAELARPAAEFAERHSDWRVLGYLLRENGTGVAPAFIIFNASLTAGLVWLPYDALVEFAMILGSVTVLLWMYSYVWFKVKRADAARPFNIPGGTTSAVLLVLPVVGMACAMLYFAAVSRDVVLGLQDAKIVGATILVLLGVGVNVLYLGYKECLRYRSGSYALAASTNATLMKTENRALLMPTDTALDCKLGATHSAGPSTSYGAL